MKCRFKDVGLGACAGAASRPEHTPGEATWLRSLGMLDETVGACERHRRQALKRARWESRYSRGVDGVAYEMAGARDDQ